jgi:putative two-component system hydrogenase maturation factor HypX/HoxX
LLLCSAFNGLAQRVEIELRAAGHTVHRRLMSDDIGDVVAAVDPDLIVCPYLRQRVPAEVWTRWTTLIIHPGPEGDRGPSSLDWAILEGVSTWGVTALQATDVMDGGPVWASRNFAMPAEPPRKSALYAGVVTDAAAELACEVVAKFGDPSFTPRPVQPGQPGLLGRERPLMTQDHRAFSWADPAADIVRNIRAGDGSPGVRTRIAGLELSVFDAYPGRAPVPGPPGSVAHCSHGAVLIRSGTDDAGHDAVWIGRTRVRGGPRAGIKLPAAALLREQLGTIPELLQPLDRPSRHGGRREVTYHRDGPVGVVSVDVYNGAWNTALCRRVLAAWEHAASQDTPVIVLTSGDVFGNGIDLNAIEAAQQPPREAWDNIVAIDEVCRAIICTRQLVIAAVGANAGAGGVMVALGADQVVARGGVVLNPHYATMGLYGSEYWTYVLPGRTGRDDAERLTTACQPIGAAEAARLGLVDHALPGSRPEFDGAVADYAQQLATSTAISRLIEEKRLLRLVDEAGHPLEAYRVAELARMREDIFFDAHGFAARRRAFVTKQPAAAAVACQAG